VQDEDAACEVWNDDLRQPEQAEAMRNAKLVAAILGGILASVGLIVILWWHTSVDEHIGYCKTPTDTCINRQDAALGEPCECHGMGGGVFGLDSTGVVVPKDSK
jgi:hypothetical protein